MPHGRKPQRHGHCQNGEGKGGSSRYKLGPEAVLEKLVHAVESARPRPRYFVTKPTYYMAIAKRVLPRRVLDYVLDWASDQ